MRPWRRHKRYTLGELRWQAKRNGWDFSRHKKEIEITVKGQTLATFLEQAEPLPAGQNDAKLRAFAALQR